jgi:hypothetical protein
MVKLALMMLAFFLRIQRSRAVARRDSLLVAIAVILAPASRLG